MLKEMIHPMTNRSGWDKYVTYKAVLGGLALAALAVAAAAAILFFTRPAPAASGSPLSAVVTIIPAPTLTPAVVIPTPSITMTATPNKNLPPGTIGIGVYIQITGTGGDGLRLRSEPRVSKATEKFLGMESEVFLVREGPKQSEGYVWWFLEAPYDKNRTGWAVANYLKVVQSP